MTKAELLKLLEQVDDDAIVYVETEEEIYHIRQAIDVVNGDDVQNEITLYCW